MVISYPSLNILQMLPSQAEKSAQSPTLVCVLGASHDAIAVTHCVVVCATAIQ